MNNIQLLTAMLGYPTQFPKAPITRSIRMLFKDRTAVEPYKEKPKYTPIKYRINKKPELGVSHKKILQLLNKEGTATAADIAEGTGWTQNHCSMILTSLHKKGLVKRRKASGNGTRWYIYTKLEAV